MRNSMDRRAKGRDKRTFKQKSNHYWAMFLPEDSPTNSGRDPCKWQWNSLDQIDCYWASPYWNWQHPAKLKRQPYHVKDYNWRAKDPKWWRKCKRIKPLRRANKYYSHMTTLHAYDIAMEAFEDLEYECGCMECTQNYIEPLDKKRIYWD